MVSVKGNFMTKKLLLALLIVAHSAFGAFPGDFPSDAGVISGADLSLTGSVTSALSVTGGDIDATRSESAGDVIILSKNTDTGATSRAVFRAEVGTGSAGDPLAIWAIEGVKTYHVGIDNSASDDFIIGDTATVGGSTAINVSSASAVIALGVGATYTNVRIQSAGTTRIQTNATGMGFFNTTPIAQPTVTGSRGSNAALTSLLTHLASFGLIVDGSSA